MVTWNAIIPSTTGIIREVVNKRLSSGKTQVFSSCDFTTFREKGLKMFWSPWLHVCNFHRSSKERKKGVVKIQASWWERKANSDSPSIDKGKSFQTPTQGQQPAIVIEQQRRRGSVAEASLSIHPSICSLVLFRVAYIFLLVFHSCIRTLIFYGQYI